MSPILVTGAAGTLGRSLVAALAETGHSVLALDIAASMPDCGQQGFAGSVDLAEPKAVAAAIAALTADREGIAGLVNVAGGFRWETLERGSIDAWDDMYRINLRTAVVCTQAALPLLRAGRGSIVNVGAQAALRASAGMGAYAASKGGVMRLTEGLADEEKDNGVRVNAVLPSIIDTPANRSDMADADFSRWVAPEALASVIVFLLSDGARAITGATIPVSGRC